MAAQGREHPRVAEPVTAIVEGESLGDVLLYDGRLYRIVQVYDWGWSRYVRLGASRKPGAA